MIGSEKSQAFVHDQTKVNIHPIT